VSGTTPILALCKKAGFPVAGRCGGEYSPQGCAVARDTALQRAARFTEGLFVPVIETICTTMSRRRNSRCRSWRTAVCHGCADVSQGKHAAQRPPCAVHQTCTRPGWGYSRLLVARSGRSLWSHRGAGQQLPGVAYTGPLARVRPAARRLVRRRRERTLQDADVLPGCVVRTSNKSPVEPQATSPTRCAGRIIKPGLSCL
jgi:hypothetical protein